ncbi:MAG: hypothetical protein SOW66_05145 [Porphyromonas sp.]|nr:hypothetical protein [Porphyromonas sp.]
MNQTFSRLGRRAWVMLGVACLATFGSCSKDDLSKGVKPQASVDERKSKAHGDPVKAVLTLYSGHLHGIMGFHQNPDIKGLKHLNRVQTVIMRYTPTGEKDENGRAIYAWRASNEPGTVDKFRVQYGVYMNKDKDYPERRISKYALVYGLVIRYFDANNKDITTEFTTKGQENIHQHFFIPSDIKAWYTNITWNSPDVVALKPPYDKIVATRFTSKGEELNGEQLPREEWKPFYYFYSDTDPIDKSYKASITGTNTDVKFLGFDNPMGFKGWFGFNNPIYDTYARNNLDKCIYADFNLGIELLHAATSKTSRNENGKPSPFDEPSDAQRQSDLWDVNLSVPTIIFGSQEDGLYINPVEINDPRGGKKTVRNVSALGRKPKFDELRDFSQDYVRRLMKAFNATEDEIISDLYIISTADPKLKESGALFF